MNKTVLFVDDEASILKAIKRELFDAPFKIITASSAESGLEILKEHNIDIVVSDVKMPNTSGIEFLTIVKENYPKINRVILSGYVDEETVFVAIQQGVATTYFVKPWKPDILHNKLIHILQMQELFKNNKLLNTLNSIKRIPVLPEVYSNLLQAIGKKKSNKDIAKIISEDISVSTKVLQVVNSAFYGMQRKVSSIERGIALLGLYNIKDLVLTLNMISELKWSSYQKHILEDIIFNSSLINNIFKFLYKKKYDQNVKEEFSSIGITHNIGKIVLLQYFPDNYKKVLDFAKIHPRKNFFECELEIGCDNVPHTQIGAYILNLWNLHSINIEAALYHHEPEKSSKENKEIINIFNLAIRLVDTIDEKSEEDTINCDDFANKDFSAEYIKKVIKIIINENKIR